MIYDDTKKKHPTFSRRKTTTTTTQNMKTTLHSLQRNTIYRHSKSQ